MGTERWRIRVQLDLPHVLNDHLACLAMRPAFVGQRQVDGLAMLCHQHEGIRNSMTNRSGKVCRSSSITTIRPLKKAAPCPRAPAASRSRCPGLP